MKIKMNAQAIMSSLNLSDTFYLPLRQPPVSLRQYPRWRTSTEP